MKLNITHKDYKTKTRIKSSCQYTVFLFLKEDYEMGDMKYMHISTCKAQVFKDHHVNNRKKKIQKLKYKPKNP